MKCKILIITLVLNSLITMTFFTPAISITDLNGTKWISPLTDECYDSLCFISYDKVMLYDCENDLYTEVGYTYKNDHIEINAYSKNMDPVNRLILYQDNGVLRQLPEQVNSFPRIYIKVEAGYCN